MRLKLQSSAITCAAVWLLGITLAAVPLMPRLSHWTFYEQTGVCAPLPITRTNVQTYSFAIMIVMNFALFIIVAVGQVSIFFAVQASSKALESSKSKPMDTKLARRLASVVFSNFLCWFPIGLLGLLAWRGMAVPGEVNVAIITFVMPLNASLNPFLYTLNILLEKRREKEQKAALVNMEAKLRSELEEKTNDHRSVAIQTDM